MRKGYDFEKKGLLALGYIKKLPKALEALSNIIGIDISEDELNTKIEEAYNQGRDICYHYDENGDLTQGEYNERTCRYAIETDLTDSNGKMLYASFVKDSSERWNGVMFSTIEKLEASWQAYYIGNISFINYKSANKFIKDLESSLLPGEIWKFRSCSNDLFRKKTDFDILQSYIQYVFDKLLSEYSVEGSKNYGKIVLSENNDYALFNTGLLDKYASDIYIVGQIYAKKDSKFILSNPKIVEDGLLQLTGMGFDIRTMPDVVEFFDSIEDIIFDTSANIDMPRTKLQHIIEDGIKRNRFPEKYKNMYETGNIPDIVRDLKAAIDNAKKIAKRNYKYVIPQYRAAKGDGVSGIQFLMPIFLNTQYGQTPDFALVLSVINTKTGKYYRPETVIELAWAYNNARVICKPENTWLNPEAIDDLNPSLD